MAALFKCAMPLPASAAENRKSLRWWLLFAKRARLKGDEHQRRICLRRALINRNSLRAPSPAGAYRFRINPNPSQHENQAQKEIRPEIRILDLHVQTPDQTQRQGGERRSGR